VPANQGSQAAKIATQISNRNLQPCSRLNVILADFRNYIDKARLRKFIGRRPISAVQTRTA
jgi:hypothetical protein